MPRRVIRGGGWSARPGLVVATSRVWNLPGQRESGVGFRLALAPELSR